MLSQRQPRERSERSDHSQPPQQHEEHPDRDYDEAPAPAKSAEEKINSGAASE